MTQRRHQPQPEAEVLPGLDDALEDLFPDVADLNELKKGLAMFGGGFVATTAGGYIPGDGGTMAGFIGVGSMAGGAVAAANAFEGDDNGGGGGGGDPPKDPIDIPGGIRKIKNNTTLEPELKGGGCCDLFRSNIPAGDTTKCQRSFVGHPWYIHVAQIDYRLRNPVDVVLRVEAENSTTGQTFVRESAGTLEFGMNQIEIKRKYKCLEQDDPDTETGNWVFTYTLITPDGRFELAGPREFHWTLKKLDAVMV